MSLNQYVRTRLRRIGAITTLSTMMALTLVACGTPDTTAQPTATIISPSVTETAITDFPTEVPTAVGTLPPGATVDGTIPDAVATGTAEAMELTPTPNGTVLPSTPTASQGGQTDGDATEVEGT